MDPNDGRVVSNFIVQALMNEDLTVYGDGSQTRSFCFVDDMIAGILALFEKPFIGGPINIGNPKPISMLELANEVINLVGSTSKIRFVDLPLDDPLQREPVIDKAKKHLNWEPSIERTIGLERTITYFRSELSRRGVIE